jgi:hypothetical protein
MARFADPVRLGGVGELVADNRGWPNSTSFEKSQHSLEMSAISNDIGA